MLKSQELARGDSCLNKSAADEPVFVLCARDPRAAQAIRHWATMSHGEQPPDKIQDALHAAAEMDKWREDRAPKTFSPPSMPPMPSLNDPLGLVRHGVAEKAVRER